MQQIILASTSPRRKELLRQLIGDRFIVVPSSYKENNSKKIPPHELVLQHALGKAQQVATRYERAYVIGADTVIVHEDYILGKPKTKDAAIEMLKQISGSTVQCITGLAIVQGKEKIQIQDHEISELSMATISDKTAEQYVRLGESLDRAGGFAIEQHGAIFVKTINGCYSSIVGLPLFKLNDMFSRIGISLLT